MSNGEASVIDRAGLGYPAWVLRALLDRENRVLEYSAMAIGGVVGEYLRNVDLAAEIAECQKTMEVSDRLARMLMLLVARLASKPSFRGYCNADMQADALLHLVRSSVTRGRDPRPNILKFDHSFAERKGTAPIPSSTPRRSSPTCSVRDQSRAAGSQLAG